MSYTQEFILSLVGMAILAFTIFLGHKKDS